MEEITKHQKPHSHEVARKHEGKHFQKKKTDWVSGEAKCPAGHPGSMTACLRYCGSVGSTSSSKKAGLLRQWLRYPRTSS